MLLENEIIVKVAKILADDIEKNDLRGCCNVIPFIYKYYLKRFYDINVEFHYGIIEYKESFAMHNWNSFNHKLIDITIHKQLIEEVDSNCIILDDVYISKDTDIKRHEASSLPNKYLDFIEFAAETEHDLLKREELSQEDKKYLEYLTKHLDEDAKLIKMEKLNINDVSKVRTYLKSNFKKEMNNYFKLINKELKNGK